MRVLNLKMKNKNLILDFAWITLSAVLTAIPVNMMFQHSGLAPGGITGMCIIFSSITHIPVDIMTLCISIPLLVLGALLLGKSFGIKTLYITLMTPLAMRLIPSFAILDFLNSVHPILELFVEAIIGGLLVGTAIGIALNHDCATGGTDLIALLINHFLKMLKVPHIIFCLDATVVVASGLIGGDVMISVFSLFSLYVIMKTISFITEHKLTANKNEVQ